jgi:hypothetical protein
MVREEPISTMGLGMENFDRLQYYPFGFLAFVFKRNQSCFFSIFKTKSHVRFASILPSFNMKVNSKDTLIFKGRLLKVQLRNVCN